MYRLGVVYDLSSETTLYGQLATGETHPRGGDVVRVSNSLREADTVTVEQYEVGIKQSSADGRVNWTLALFDITRKDLLIDDPDSSDPTDFIVVPKQTAQGIEIGVDFSPNDSLITHANAALVRSERETGTGTIATPYAPELTVNAGLLYMMSSSLRFGADFRYVDERPYDDLPLPSYSIVDLSVGYSINEATRLTLNAQNVLDEVYATADHWTGGQWLVGRPRTLSLTLDLDF